MHSPTLMLVLTILLAMMTCVLFAAWMFNPRVAGIREWFIGYVAALINLLNFIFKPVTLPLVDLFITQTCLVATGIFAYRGVVFFVGKQSYPIKTSLLTLVGVLGATSYYLLVEPNLTARFAIGSVATGVFLTMAGLLMLQTSSRDFPARILFGGALLFHGVFMFVRPFLVTAPNKELLFADLSFGLSQLILVEQVVVSVLFTLGIVMMINERISHELNIRADRDFLTNMLNRGAFIRQLQKSVSFSMRSSSPLTLMVLDVDHFKSINDQFGHSAGDLALVQFAKVINDTIRAEDTAGRLGGEEFAILLPNTTLDSAMSIAERLRQNVADTTILSEEKSIRLNVSIGVASLSSSDSLEALISRADHAMYAAKLAGRNRVERESVVRPNQSQNVAVPLNDRLEMHCDSAPPIGDAKKGKSQVKETGLVALLNRFLNAGVTESLSLLDRNAVITTNTGILIAQGTNLLLLLGTPLLFNRFEWFPTMVILFAIGLYEFSHWQIVCQRYFAARLTFSIGLVLVVTTLAIYFGTASQLHFLFVPIGIGSLMVWPNRRFAQFVFAFVAFSAFAALSLFASSTGILNQAPIFRAGYVDVINTLLAFLITYIVVLSLVLTAERLQILLESARQVAATRADVRETQMLNALNALALARDNETGNHILRTQFYVKTLAERLMLMGHYSGQMTPTMVDLLFGAAPLHDVGKIGIPDKILLKPGKLDDDEWKVMQTHTLIGESVLQAAMAKDYVEPQDQVADVLNLAIKIAGGHHEHWDGSGYPRGLQGEQIPLGARIMSVADAYDALISKRPYKSAWSHERAFEEIVNQGGVKFDPLVITAFRLEKDRFREIALSLVD